MGLKKSFKKAVKKVTKVVKTVVKTAVGAAIGGITGFMVGGPIGAITGSLIGATASGGIGTIVDDYLGLDSAGNEVTRWGQDIQEIGKVLTGAYHRDAAKVEAARLEVEYAVNNYNATMEDLTRELDSLIAFHEIFKMSMQNRIEGYSEVEQARLNELIEKYKNMVAVLKSEYSFITGLTEGTWLGKIIASGLLILGGIAYDLTEIMSGRASSDNYKNILQVIITIIVVVILVIAGFFTAGATWVAAVAAILSIISAVLMLDGMYAQGLLMGTIMSSLDFLFNDVLNLDDTVGSDFNKFDSDHEDYAQMVMYIKVSVVIASVLFSLGSNTSGAASQLGQTLGMGANTMATAGRLSQLYSAYSMYSAVNNVVEANNSYRDLRKELESKKEEIEEALSSKYRKNFMKHYKDSAYFLQDQQEFVDRYVWSMTAKNMYVDPYGTTPVANIRFTPDDDTRMVDFGFEDMFDESKQAGSKGYFNSILYG